MPSSSHLITDKVLRHVLPSDKPLNLWIERGTGRPCDGCEKPITTAEYGYDLDLPGDVILRFHVACADYWHAATGNNLIPTG